MSYLQRLVDAQNTDLHAARSYIDRAETEKRELSVEERTAWDSLNKQMDERAAHINDVQRDEQRNQEIAVAVASAPEVFAEVRAAQPTSDVDLLRKMAMGEIRSHMFERRNLNTGDDSQVVPQSFYDVIQENLRYVGPMMDSGLFTVLNTASGEDIKVPVEATRPVGTATAEGATFGISDPTFTNVTLRSHKYSTLVVVSRELLEDTGIDLIGFLGRQLGVSIGTAVNSALTLGTGTLEPQGIVPATSLGETGGTASVVGSFTADDLIDLAHSIDTAYALRPQVAWMMSRSTLGAVRKLKDNQGAYLYQPADTVGTPNTLLGYRIVENPYVANIGSAAKSVLFGDMSSFHVRMVGGIEVARSDEAYFTSDQVAFRARIRVDGALGQADAVKHFLGGTA
jgi:HK97 family phage major capsid protein